MITKNSLFYGTREVSCIFVAKANVDLKRPLKKKALLMRDINFLPKSLIKLCIMYTNALKTPCVVVCVVFVGYS